MSGMFGLSQALRGSLGLRALACALPALVLSSLLLLPFLNKAFTIDDTVFLLEAKQLQKDPLAPTAFDLVWYENPEPLSKMMASGPVVAALLYPVVALDDKEWVGHLIVLVCFWISILATAALCLRLCDLDKDKVLRDNGATVARWATLLLAATPTALALGTTVMPDIPALALGTVAVERMYAFRQRPRPLTGLLLWLSLSVAILTRSQLSMLVPLCFLIAMGPASGQGDLGLRRVKQVAMGPLLPVFVGVGLFVTAVLRISADPRSGADVSKSVGYWLQVDPHLVARHVSAFLTYYVTCFPLVLPFLLLRGGKKPRPWSVVALLGVVLATVSSTLFLVYVSGQPWMWAPLVWFGLMGLVLLFQQTWRTDNWDALVLCAWLLVGLPVVTYVHFAPKYLVVAAPAVCILVARRACQVSPTRRWLALAPTIGLGSLLGVLIASADQNFANLGRRGVHELIAPLIAQGKSVWFAGHWGFHFYAAKAGAKPLTLNPPHPIPGEYVAASEKCHGGDLIRIVSKRKLISFIEHGDAGGRIMASNAGFYSDAYGYLPWTWSTELLERISLFEVMQ